MQRSDRSNPLSKISAGQRNGSYAALEARISALDCELLELKRLQKRLLRQV